MGYTTEAKVRELLNLDTTKLPDSVITPFLTKGDQVVIRTITTRVVDEKLKGNIDGTNTTFYTKYKPLADIDADKDIDTADVKVYTWDDEDDPDTKTEVTVSSVDAEDGIIKLVSAPSIDIAKVTADYSFYTNRIDWELVELATTLYVAYRVVLAELLLIPESYTLGSLRIKWNRRYPAYMDLHRDFLRTIDLIRKGYSYEEATRIIEHELSETGIIVGVEE